MTYQPGSRTIKVVGRDRRPTDILMWDAARTDKANLSGSDIDRDNGVARILRGGSRTLTRATKAWIVNPTDATRCIEVAASQPATQSDGELVEQAATNGFSRSSFKSGTTGMTFTPGTGGTATVETGADYLFFNADASGNVGYLSSGTGDCGLGPPESSSYTAPINLVLSIDYWHAAGVTLYMRMRRDADNYYWNGSTFQLASTEIALPSVTSRNPASRYVLRFAAGSTSTFNVAVWFLAGTSGRKAWVGHFQIEPDQLSSRIICDGSTVTRNKTETTYGITTAAKNYDPALGTFWCEVIPEWNSADISADKVVYYMTTNGGADYDKLIYQQANARFAFVRKVGVSTYTAYKATTVTRGTKYAVAARWTGSGGELGLSNYTLSCFVNGVKGTDQTSAAPTFTSPETLHMGQDSSAANQFHGIVRDRRVYPYALTDAEIARLP
jgi:hypothetical protein